MDLVTETFFASTACIFVHLDTTLLLISAYHGNVSPQVTIVTVHMLCASLPVTLLLLVLTLPGVTLTTNKQNNE